MGKRVKKYLLVFSIIYITICIVAATEKWMPLHSIVVHFFIMFAIILILRQVLLLTFSIIKKYRKPKNIRQLSQPDVSIIIPAYNEEVVILEALASILKLNYNNYEIIIVDDGSTDNTAELVRGFLKKFKSHISTLVISQRNAGKANALNTGLIHASGTYILCVDADARLNKDCLLNGIHHFNDPKVGAVAGNVVVANERNWLTRFQQLEYLTSQNFIRRGLALFGLVTIIPGPIGFFRRAAILDAGGYREDKMLFAEDADLSFRLLSKGWKINSEESMLAETEAPSSPFSFFRQRYRWKRGIYQALNDNFIPLVTSKTLKGPAVALFLILESFLLDIIGFGVTVFLVVNIIYTFSLNLLPIWLALLFALDFIVLLISVPFWQLGKWVFTLIVQKITYTYALQTWGVLSLIDEWISTEMTWDKLNRKGISNNGRTRMVR